MFNEIKNMSSDKLLELSENFERLKHKKWVHQRNISIIFLLIIIGFFIFLTLFLAPSFQFIYLEVIKMLLAFLAGFGGGYGFKTWRNGN